MAHEGIILQRNKNYTVPGELINKISEEFKSCACYAFADGDEVLYDQQHGTMALQNFEEIQSEYNTDIIFFCGKNDSKYLEDDLQPFTLLEVNKKPVLVAFLEGDFSSFHHPGTNHSDSFFVVNDFLRPEIKDMFQDVKGGLKELMKELDTPRFRRSLRNVIMSRGQIAILSKDGEILLFQKNDKYKEFEWGKVSQHLNYEGVEEAEEKQPEKELTFKEKLALKRKAKAEEEGEPKSTPHVPRVPEKPTEVPKPDTAVPTKVEPEEKVVYPADTYHGADLKKWYNRHRVGGRPQNWQDRPGIPISQLQPNSPLRGQLKSFLELGQAKEIKAPEEVKPQGVTTEVPPIIAPQNKKEIIDVFLKDGITLKDIEELKKAEKDTQSFTEQTGYKWEDIMRWPFSTFRKLALTHPHATAVLLNEFRNRALVEAPAVKEEKELTFAEKLALKKAGKSAA